VAFHQVVACQQQNMLSQSADMCSTYIELQWYCREMVLHGIVKATIVKHHWHHPRSCRCWSSTIYHWLHCSHRYVICDCLKG
jgi:hypothetical protein